LDPTIVLVFFHRGGGVVVSLEPGASIVVGRESPSDVVIADPSLSRRHARFAWSDGEVTVDDLSSTNGTLLRCARVEHASVEVGDIISLGAVAVAILDSRRTGARPKAVVGHDAFRMWIEDELVRSKHFGRPFSMIMVLAQDGSAASCFEAVRMALRPIDRLA